MVTQCVYGQITFERTYGGANTDEGACVRQTLDGGYILVGGTNSYGAGSRDIYLIKTDAYGDTLWTRAYGGAGDDMGFMVRQTMDGGYIIAGYTSSFGAGHSDGYVIRADGNGDTLWTRTLGGYYDDFFGSVIENSDGSFMLVGSTYSFTTGSSAVYLNKLDASGELLWSKVFEKFAVNIGGVIIEAGNDCFLIAAITDDYEGPLFSRLYLLKINNNGDTLWTKTYINTNGNLIGGGITISQDSSIVMCSPLKYPNGESDMSLLKTDLSGNVKWFKTYGGDDYQSGSAIHLTNDDGFILTGLIGDATKLPNPFCSNNILLAGNVEKGWTNGDLYLIKINSNGDSLWSKKYGGNGNDVGNSVQQTSDNGFIICGWKTINSNIDMYLIKTDNSGVASLPDNGNIDNKIVLFPNPSNGIVNIQSSAVYPERTVLEIINYLGQIILTTQINLQERNKFDLSPFGGGIYFLRFKGNDFMASRKIIINYNK